ncbi:ATP-binding cassette domain-containing protein, partial [Streptomyces anulatus]|uniref:ATP-binding cassette domain-containing protein n=1 Tax=Streptomyces anulatus TaxID=1892 RepID=UPI00364BF000
MMTQKQRTTPRTGSTAGTGPAAAVRLADVSVRFRSKKRDVTAIGDVSLDVAPGEFVAIVGPSGCGKSTLLKLVAGLLTASSGEVLLGGEQVTGPRHDIGYVFQRAALLEWRSALRNILLQAEIRHMEPGGGGGPGRAPNRRNGHSPGGGPPPPPPNGGPAPHRAASGGGVAEP